MSQSERVADIMTPDPITVREGAALAEARARLQSSHVTGLPVIDVANRVVGVISKTDLVALARYDDLGRGNCLTLGPAGGRSTDCLLISR
jgi:CBS domain-containing protein